MTSIRGIPNDKESDFANDAPTNNDPKSPGPLVYAMASSLFFSIFAIESAELTTGIIFFWCALEANSGTTPP